MKICIWQLRPSLHQLALVESLYEKCDITWLLENNDLDILRLDMGWSNISQVPFKLLEDYNSMIDFVNTLNSNCIHVFGGFSSSKNLENILNELVLRKKRVFVQSESYRLVDLKGLLGAAKFYYKKIVQNKFDVEGVFSIGNLGVDFFSNPLLNFKSIKPFGYFTVRKNTLKIMSNDKYSIIFVGQHIERKGVDILLKAIRYLDFDFELQLIGDGNLRSTLEKYVVYHNLEEKVFFKGNLDNSEVLSKIGSSDLLILPSRFDGWGAVVSEALMLGTPVITSDKCGSSVLLSDGTRGTVVKAGSEKSLTNAISESIQKGKVSRARREEIISWSNCISGEVAAQYMIDCINNKKPNVPWID